MFKKCKVVMLPTNEKAIRPLIVNPSTGKMEISEWLGKTFDYPASEYQKVGYKTSHLYFLSDEEIKEGDWMYNPEREPSILQCVGKGSLRGWEKIIATTAIICTGYSKETSKTFNDYSYLPQPSRSFIEKYVEEYNKGNLITEVMVEYNLMNKGYDKPEDYPYQECEILKVNPKDNTITIRKVKDSWNRKEVIALLHHFRFCGDDVEKFAEENL